ncbi:MAG: TolC family protein [Robiginitomaculum sp.]|nr:TolC family protein [Robiginitomaculum sp.]MDQ7076674.1 TolC family protein [Robiginitomaculum sp.]
MNFNAKALFGALWVGIAFVATPMAQSQDSSPAPQQSSRPLVVEFAKEVLANHPGIAAAQAELDAARARAKGAGRALYNPEIEAGYENAASTTTSVGISQTLDMSGKRKARAATGQADVMAARAALELVQKSLLANVLEALAVHQSAFEQLQLTASKVRLARDFLTLSQTRKTAGDLSESELLTARLALSQAMAEQSRAKGDLSRARERLAAIAGRPREVWPFMVGTPQGVMLQSWSGELNRLPEMRLVRAQSDSFRTRILLADKMRKADPTLGLSLGQESNGLGGNATLFGIRLSIPLQIRNSYSESVTAARAEAVGAEANARKMRQRVEARLNATTERYLAAASAWQDWQNGGAGDLEAQRTLLKTLWEAGELNAVSYLIQLNQTFDAQAAAIDLKGALWRSWFDWLDASNSATSWLEAIQ